MAGDDMSQIALDPMKAKDLKIAILERQLIKQQGEQILKNVERSIERAEVKFQDAWKAAGLDPALNYTIDFDAETASLVGEKE